VSIYKQQVAFGEQENRKRSTAKSARCCLQLIYFWLMAVPSLGLAVR